MRILGIDIGGSGIKGAIIDTRTGEMESERHRISTPQPATPEAVVKACVQLVEHFSWNGPVGAGFPGVVKQGKIFTAANLDKSWIGNNIQDLLHEKLNVDVSVLNDADAVGLAEAEFGAGKESTASSILVITLGTGIGSALVVNGRVVPNMEMGHVYYKSKVIWEKYAADSARKREDLAWQDWGKRVNKFLKEMVRLLWPDLIIVGGGASKKFDKYSNQINVEVPVVTAKLLNHAGIIGAALYAEQALVADAEDRMHEMHGDQTV